MAYARRERTSLGPIRLAVLNVLEILTTQHQAPSLSTTACHAWTTVRRRVSGMNVWRAACVCQGGITCHDLNVRPARPGHITSSKTNPSAVIAPQAKAQLISTLRPLGHVWSASAEHTHGKVSDSAQLATSMPTRPARGACQCRTVSATPVMNSRSGIAWRVPRASTSTHSRTRAARRAQPASIRTRLGPPANRRV